MTEPCATCGYDNRNGSHVHPWTCITVMKKRIAYLELRLRAAETAASEINEAWREERARIAAPPDVADIISQLANVQVCPLTHRPRTTREVMQAHALVEFATLALDAVRIEERKRWGEEA